MIKLPNIAVLMLVSRWVPVATSVLLLGVQVLRLVIPSKDKPVAAENKK